MIVTDGQVDEESTLAAAQPLKRREVELICIGTGGASKEVLSRIATRSDLATCVSTESLSGSIRDASRLLAGPRGK